MKQKIERSRKNMRAAEKWESKSFMQSKRALLKPNNGVIYKLTITPVSKNLCTCACV